MSKSSVSFLALSCVGAFHTLPAYADDLPRTPVAGDPDQRRDDDILVTGERLRRSDDPKAVAPVLDTPRSIVLIPKEVIQQTGSVSLQDALRTVPGITFGAAEGGNPLGDRPFIRGFDTQGSIYVDGVRDLGAQSREVFATETIQIVRGSDSTLGGRGSAGGTINIISKLPQVDDFGSISGSYGNADFKRVTADVNLRLGAMAAFRIEGLWHDQDIAGRDALYARRWGVAPSLSLGLGTPTRLTVSYYYLESHELPDAGIPYLYTIGNAPGTGTIASRPALGTITTAGGTTGYVDRSVFYGLTGRDFRDSSTHQATLRAEHDFGGITLRNTARFTRSEQNYIMSMPDDSQGNVYGTAASDPTTGAAGLRGDRTSGGYVWRRTNTRYGYTQSIVNQTDLYGQFHTGSIAHSVAAGAELSWEQARRGTYVTPGLFNAAGTAILASGSTITPRCNTATLARSYCTTLFSPDPNDPWVAYASDTATNVLPVARIGLAGETQNDANTRALYAFDSITLVPQLILNLGARYDRFASTTRLPGTAGVRFRRTDRLFNWQAGLVFKPTPDTSLYASYATAATPPNSLLGEGREDNALPTTAQTAAILDLLKPQKTKSYEIGAKATLLGERLLLTAAAFQTQIDNARVTGPNNTVEFIGESRIRGIELGATGTILPGWTVFGGYTHLDPKVIDGGSTVFGTVAVPSVNTGRQMPQTTRNSFTATSNVSLWHRLELGGTAIYMGRQIAGYSDDRSATRLVATKLVVREAPAYWRFDARASVKLTDRVDISVNAQNLTDKVYYTQLYTTHFAQVAAGRTVFGTLGLRF
ncbi:TonB-dependent receptor [Sphingomonas kyungheensis]|uniref:TonB-dependent receptor n=1 Tax=Sphingomonas kyungheensis TaxID=1069987 RepID=A0ABU8GZF0_9SPHN